VSTLSARLVGGPTAIIEYAGMRWLTDPALSPPGEYGALVKTTGPAIAADASLGSMSYCCPMTTTRTTSTPPGANWCSRPSVC
jgi:hypothetical protein